MKVSRAIKAILITHFLVCLHCMWILAAFHFSPNMCVCGFCTIYRFWILIFCYTCVRSSCLITMEVFLLKDKYNFFINRFNAMMLHGIASTYEGSKFLRKLSPEIMRHVQNPCFSQFYSKLFISLYMSSLSDRCLSIS